MRLSPKYQDCVGCIFHIGIYLSSLTTPLRYNCLHNAPEKQQNFEISKISFVLSCCVLTSITISVMGFTHVLEDICAIDKGLCVILSSDLIYGLNGFCLLVCSLINVKIKVVDLIGWSRLIEKRFSFNIDTIFTAKMGKSIGKLFYSNIFINTFAFSTISIYYYWILDDDMDYKFARYLIILISILTQTNLLIFLSVQSVFYVKIFQRLKGLIEEDLENYALIQNQLSNKLSELNKFLLAINKNGKYSFKFYDPTVVLFMCITICNLIASMYLTVKFWGTDYVTFLIIIMGRTCFTIFGIIHLTLIFQRPIDLRDELLSYLFKYPISNLSRAEAAQLENLLTTLIVQKPYFVASDIFKLDARLLASVCGTIVTYVLVALQFRTAWMK